MFNSTPLYEKSTANNGWIIWTDTSLDIAHIVDVLLNGPSCYTQEHDTATSCLAGTASVTRNPLLEDFILLAQKLEKLSFVYNKGQVIIIPLSEDQ